MTVQYDMGADDLGIAPTTPLQSATITFDICPGATFLVGGGLDTVFNDVPVFSLSFGGTDSAPGTTVGFTDRDPTTFSRPRLLHFDGSTYNSQDVAWTGRFDQIQIDIDFLTQTYDMTWTQDANLGTIAFDAGNTPQLIASGASLSSPISTLDFLYFRAHTDPADGITPARLEKSFLDNFNFSVKPVPEPATAGLVMLGGLAALRRR